MYTNRSFRLRNTQSAGFSLIEVLISVVVLGIGLLGMGGLQVAALKSTNNAHYITTASLLARDLGDRMSANVEAVSEGLYEEPISCSKRLTNACGKSGAVGCTAEELSEFDIQEIQCGVKRGSKREGGVIDLLPNSSIEVSCTNNCELPRTRQAELTVTISWDQQGTHENIEDDDQVRSFSMIIIP